MDQENCKNCGYKLITKAIKKSAGQLRKSYYYTAYYYCVRCQKLYHSDKFKVINSQTLPLHMDTIHREHKNGIAGPGKYDVEIWTDGSCVGNGTERARAAWAFVSDKTEKAGLVTGKQTNNVAEGLAIYHALKWAAEKGYKKIKLATDSQISLHNLQKDPAKVKLNTEIFYDIAHVIREFGLTVVYEKVLGHSGNPNNERADKLATELAARG